MHTPQLPESRLPGATSWISSILLLGLVISLLYTFTYRGTFRTDDEHILAARAASLALRGSLSYAQLYGNQRVQNLTPMGDAALQIEPAQAVVAAPLFLLGLRLGLGGLHSLFVLSLLVTACSAVFVAISARNLGHPPRVALITGLLFGSATIAWPYAETFYRDVLAMGLAALAFLGWSLFLQKRGGWQGLVVMVGALLLGVLAKNSELALLVVFCGGAVWVAARSGAGRLGAWLAAAAIVAVALLLVAYCIPGSGPLARFSLGYYRYLIRHFAGGIGPSMMAGLIGPFLSPAKSIFLFSPILLLALPALASPVRIQRWSAGVSWLAAVMLALAQSLFYREGWASGSGWGLHFTLPALPGLAVAMAPSVGQALEKRGWRLAGLIILGGLSAVIQWAGTVVDWRSVYALWQVQGLRPFEASASWNLRLLAIPAQLGMALSPGNWDLAWRRLVSIGHPAALIVPLFCLPLLAGLGIWLTRSRLAPPGWGPAVVGIGVLAVGIPVASLFLYGADPATLGDFPAVVALIQRASADQKPGDAVVLDSYGTALWTAMLDRWDSSTIWFSTPYAPLGPEEGGRAPEPGSALALLQDLASGHRRIWLLSSSQAPDYQAPEMQAWLHASCSRQQAWTAADSLDAELVLCILTADE
jgi:hypothetical protein